MWWEIFWMWTTLHIKWGASSGWSSSLYYLMRNWDQIKVGCIFPLVISSKSPWGSIETKTIGKTYPSLLNGGASFQWSFGPHSAWDSTESTTILTTHPSLLKGAENLVLEIWPSFFCFYKRTSKFSIEFWVEFLRHFLLIITCCTAWYRLNSYTYVRVQSISVMNINRTRVE